MAERMTEVTANLAAGNAAGDTAVGACSAGARRTAARPWGRLVAAAAALTLAGYAALWLDLPLRRTLAETVLTSQHFQFARLLGTPAELRAWQHQWGDTPDVQVVTPTLPPAPPPAPPPVTVTSLDGPTYHGWLLTVPDPSRIVVGTSRYLGRYGERPSLMAARDGAVAAVNGGGFMDPGGRGYGGAPIGVTMSEGRVVPADPDDGSDYVIGFDLQDRLVVGKWTIAQARALGIRDAVSFKPLLIMGGQPMITQGDGGWGYGPRTAIGQRRDGTVLFVVIDGRQPGSLGATLRQVQDLLLADGAVTAANLDGGSSTVLWQDGKVLNHPSSPYGERPVPTAFLIMPPGFDADAQARSNLSADVQVTAVPGPIAPPLAPPPPAPSTSRSATTAGRGTSAPSLAPQSGAAASSTSAPGPVSSTSAGTSATRTSTTPSGLAGG